MAEMTDSTTEIFKGQVDALVKTAKRAARIEFLSEQAAKLSKELTEIQAEIRSMEPE